jgi:hypothetical protein
LPAVVTQPLRELGLAMTRHATGNEAGWSHKAEDTMRRHQAPLLLRTMNHSVRKVAVTNAFSCFVGQLNCFRFFSFPEYGFDNVGVVFR